MYLHGSGPDIATVGVNVVFARMFTEGMRRKYSNIEETDSRFA